MSSTGIEFRGMLVGWRYPTVKEWNLPAAYSVIDDSSRPHIFDEVLRPFEGRRVSIRIEVMELPE